jgi:hypothetical protein
MDCDLPFTRVQGITIEDTFAHQGGKEYNKFVCIPNNSSPMCFFGQTPSVVKSFNAIVSNGPIYVQLETGSSDSDSDDEQRKQKEKPNGGMIALSPQCYWNVERRLKLTKS